MNKSKLTSIPEVDAEILRVEAELHRLHDWRRELINAAGTNKSTVPYAPTNRSTRNV